MSAMMAEVCMGESGVGLESRVARIESDVAHLKDTVTRLDKKIDRLEDKVGDRFDKVDQKLEGLDAKFDQKLQELRRSLDSKFVWMVTTMIAFGTALLAAMAKGFHWLG